MKSRDTNVDLLRASAIVMVLAYHICQRWPGSLPTATLFTRYGEYGVDLFFVLSGWLIGNLLWRERALFGNVEIGRFLSRRALRTIPSYFAALAISYLGVLFARSEPFDWGYLIFCQNYYERIPYFLVSWSLCVEEHFYLFMPFVALCLTRCSARSHVVFLLLTVVPIFGRLLISGSNELRPFGFHYTATHLRYEGLLLGVWASFLRVGCPRHWAVFRRVAVWALPPMLLLVVLIDWQPEPIRYSLFYSAISFLFLLLLVSVVDRRPVCFSDTKAVYWIASTSYSVYLTHAFTLDASLRLVAKLPPIFILQLPVVVSCIAISGLCFHRVVEVPSLLIRSYLVPSRSSKISPS
jgi:peptidoglycan/LPS O-acetylase OafA/YrhL